MENVVYFLFIVGVMFKVKLLLPKFVTFFHFAYQQSLNFAQFWTMVGLKLWKTFGRSIWKVSEQKNISLDYRVFHTYSNADPRSFGCQIWMLQKNHKLSNFYFVYISQSIKNKIFVQPTFNPKKASGFQKMKLIIFTST